ncbi:MAG: DUF1611 domain-containing protein [Calditrichales bacterium]|nr:MAG: DUF1611 domain-containing protein [Calditrichales bacterium]
MKNAIVYCEGAFNTPNGKTAHGLVRFSERYQITAVIDSRYAGKDAGEVRDNRKSGIPLVSSLAQALEVANANGHQPDYFVIGVAPDGGRMTKDMFENIKKAIVNKLNVECGLHDFMTENPELVALANQHDVSLKDVRKPPEKNSLHFFSGKIAQVDSLKVAVLGTDSAIGKRTTAWILVKSLRAIDCKTEFIGTGQTAWMQGARYGIMLDSLMNDFLTGEIEHAVWKAWHETHADILVIEGQGSLLNPAYPGGYEIVAAARPDIIIMQHAPSRKDYDGFPGFPIQPMAKQIAALEMISEKKVVAITINHENMSNTEIDQAIANIKSEFGIPAFDVLRDGADALAGHIISYLKKVR